MVLAIGWWTPQGDADADARIFKWEVLFNSQRSVFISSQLYNAGLYEGEVYRPRGPTK